MTTLATQIADTHVTRSDQTGITEEITAAQTTFQQRESAQARLSQQATFTGSTAQSATGTQAKIGAIGATPISIDVLYQAREAGSKNFSRALELLGRASETLSDARNALQNADRVAIASEVLRFEQLLQPLFECRGIGEGFANVINTIHISIGNRRGEPLSDKQITTLWRIIRALSNAPYLSFADSLSYVRELQKSGLVLNNNFFHEWASESSSVGQEQGVR